MCRLQVRSQDCWFGERFIPESGKRHNVDNGGAAGAVRGTRRAVGAPSVSLLPDFYDEYQVGVVDNVHAGTNTEQMGQGRILHCNLKDWTLRSSSPS